MNRAERDRLKARLAELRAIRQIDLTVEQKLEKRSLHALLFGAKRWEKPKLCTAVEPASDVKTVRLEPGQIDQWLAG